MSVLKPRLRISFFTSSCLLLIYLSRRVRQIQPRRVLLRAQLQPHRESPLAESATGALISVRVIEVDHDRRRIALSLRGIDGTMAQAFQDGWSELHAAQADLQPMMRAGRVVSEDGGLAAGIEDHHVDVAVVIQIIKAGPAA